MNTITNPEDEVALALFRGGEKDGEIAEVYRCQTLRLRNHYQYCSGETKTEVLPGVYLWGDLVKQGVDGGLHTYEMIWAPVEGTSTD